MEIRIKWLKERKRWKWCNACNMSETWNKMVSNKVWNDNKSEQCIVNEITLTRDIKQIAKTNAKNVVKITQNKALKLN